MAVVWVRSKRKSELRLAVVYRTTWKMDAGQSVTSSRALNGQRLNGATSPRSGTLKRAAERSSDRLGLVPCTRV